LDTRKEKIKDLHNLFNAVIPFEKQKTINQENDFETANAIRVELLKKYKVTPSDQECYKDLLFLTKYWPRNNLEDGLPVCPLAFEVVKPKDYVLTTEGYQYSLRHLYTHLETKGNVDPLNKQHFSQEELHNIYKQAHDKKIKPLVKINKFLIMRQNPIVKAGLNIVIGLQFCLLSFLVIWALKASMLAFLANPFLGLEMACCFVTPLVIGLVGLTKTLVSLNEPRTPAILPSPPATPVANSSPRTSNPSMQFLYEAQRKVGEPVVEMKETAVQSNSTPQAFIPEHTFERKVSPRIGL